ncbi:MAG: DUF4405 domain-containing protein [Hyphomicrobiaceae bacterium]
MPPALHRYATPLTTGLFLVSLISGIALFFHWGSQYFHGMHEWLSMVLIVPFVLHLWRNWRSFLCYFSHAPMGIAVVVSVVAALAFMLPAATGEGRRGGPPQMALARLMLDATPEKVAPVLGIPADQLVQRLKAAGFAGAAVTRPLAEIARDSGRDDRTLISALIQAK